MKNAFRKMCVTIYGRFCPDEGVVAGYGNRIWTKYTAKWGVQIAGMIFQTRSNTASANIYLGPSLPAFLSPNVLQYLVENYRISPIGDPKEDLEKMLERV